MKLYDPKTAIDRINAWEERQPERCAACHAVPGITRGGEWPVLEVRRIVKASWAEPTNLLLLCQWCEAKALPLGVLMAIKRDADPEQYDAHRLRELYGRPLPARAKVPVEFIAERERRVRWTRK